MTATTIRGGPSASIVPDAVKRRATGPVGAVVAGGVAVVVTVAGILVDVSPPIGVVDFPFLAIGIPAAAVVGALVGPTIRADRGIGVATLAMATLTIAVADALLVGLYGIAGLLTTTAVGNPLEMLVAIGVLWLMGLIFVGVPMLFVTTPCAATWAWIVRALARRGYGTEFE